MTRILSIAAIIALTSACGPSVATVYVKGQAKDVIGLAGHWKGDFKSNEENRVGSIDFELPLGRHTASGTVSLTPATPNAAPRTLRIAFVKVENGVLEGKIEPFMDPDCKCTLETEFRGVVDGDFVDGEYTTTMASLNKTRKGSFTMNRL